MKAIVQSGYGPPERVLRLAEIDRPHPGPGDVLVRVRAAGVNTPDWIFTTGTPYVVRLQSGLRRPRTSVRGSDLAGVVAAVGYGVTGFAPGDPVVGSTWNNRPSAVGTFAEYTVAPAVRLIKKPDSLTFADAAASVMSGLTALSAIREAAHLRAGARVLVNGASGGVGTFAVQIARHLGAEVTGVCGPGNTALVERLGADRVIDYTRADFTAGSGGYDAILDNVLNRPPRAVMRLLAPGGVFIPNSVGNTGRVLGALGRLARASVMGKITGNVASASGEAEPDRLTALVALLESGALEPVVSRTYALEQAPQAVAHMLGHHARGNLAVTVD